MIQQVKIEQMNYQDQQPFAIGELSVLSVLHQIGTPESADTLTKELYGCANKGLNPGRACKGANVTKSQTATYQDPHHEETFKTSCVESCEKEDTCQFATFIKTGDALQCVHSSGQVERDTCTFFSSDFTFRKF